MNKYILYFFLLTFFVSCNKEIEGELLRVVDMKINFTEYSSLPKNSQPYLDKYFTPQSPANNYLDEWLFSKYFSVKENSVAHITYDYRNYDKPSELVSLIAKEKLVLSNDDYSLAWNNIESSFYTPTVNPENSIPQVLNRSIKSEEGDFQIVEYNYSPTEATILLNQEVDKFNEDFNSPTSTDWGVIKTATWFNKIVEGTGRMWSTILNKTATTPNAFTYNRTEGADSWLVTNMPFDLTLGQKFQFSFDFGWGYYVANEPFRLQILVSDFFDGVNPLNSTWTDITDLFVTTESNDGSTVKLTESLNPQTPPSTGYPGLRKYKIEDFSTFKGKKIFIAFRDKLLPVKTDGSKYTTASLYFIDNIRFIENKDVASSSNVEKRYDVFKFVDGKWSVVKNNIYILQPLDYPDQNNQTLSENIVVNQLTTILNNKFSANEGERKIVIYTKSDLTLAAEDYVFENGTWKPNAPPIIKRTDKYLFKSKNEKWVFENSL